MSEFGSDRKHGRLESFLHRLLASEASRVTWYEPCIVDGGPTKKPSYNYTVLTDLHMYIIDNPPRQLRAVVTLSDISDIQVVHESPMFLKGEDRENAQHIKIFCKFNPRVYTESILRSESRFSVTPSRATSRSSSVLSEAMSVTSSISPTHDTERKQRKMRKFLMSLSWPKKKTAIHRLGNSSDAIRSTSSQDFAEISSMTSSITPGSDEPPPSRLSFSRLWPFIRVVDGRSMTPDPAMTSLDSNIMSTPESPTNGQRVSEFLNVDSPQEWLRIRRPNSAMPDHVQMDTTSLLSNNSSVISDLTVRSEPIGRSRTVLGNYADHTRPSSAMLRSISDTTDGESTSLNGVEKFDLNQDVMHIYVLKPQSSFYKNLKRAWTNCLLKQTLELNDGEDYSLKNDNREHIEYILQELHRKISSCSDNNFIQIRTLADKIQNDIAFSFMAKKMFWKDPHIFPAIVNKLRTLVLSPNGLEQHTIGYVMDKIKACTSLINILIHVFQETELCPGRLRHLTCRSGQRTKELLTTLVSMPWIPPAYRETTVTTVTSFDQFSSRDWENLMEAPLIRSVSELTNASTTVLYQYFQLANEGHELTYQQNSYGAGWMVKIISEVDSVGHELTYQQNSYGVGWMVKIISEVDSVDTFISRLMCQLLVLTSPTGQCSLSPAQAVLLHQQISILNIFISHSQALALQTVMMFGDEIRYFVINRIIAKKLQPNYPIRESLLSAVDSFRLAVLQKQTTMSRTSNFLSLHSNPLW